MRVQIVSFHCVLKNNLGQFISSSFNQDVVTNAEEKCVNSLPGFVKGLKGLKAGERKKIFVNAEEAYGYYDPKLTVELPRSVLNNGKNLIVGSEVKGALTDDGQLRNFRVISATPKKVMLDGNHPLAGQDLVFDIEVTSYQELLEEMDPTPLVGMPSNADKLLN